MSKPAPDEPLYAAYQVIATRRLGYDQMLWQTPVLGFTAQAFLLTIALAPDSSRLARLLSAVLALVVALLSIQLLRKHQHMELIDSVLLERIERELGIASALSVAPEAPLAPHTPARERRLGLRLRDERVLRGSWLVDLHSPLLWTWGLALFGLVSFAIIVLTALDVSWFG